MADNKVKKEEEVEDLDNDEIQRYSRQLILPQFGMESQQRLKKARILIIGLGGLGTPASIYLAGAGVGSLSLIDRPKDVVESSNLHRQIAYTITDVNETKIKSLTNALHARNPHVNIDHPVLFVADTEGLHSGNAVSVLTDGNFDVVLDCTDNVKARYVVGDACAVTGTTLVSGAAIGLSGQLSVHVSNRGCYRCVFPAAPPPNCVGSCDAAGVLGPVPGVIGMLMALEAIKIVSKFKGSEPLIGRLLLFDAASSDAPFRSVKLKGTSRPGCVACGPMESRIHVSEYDYDAFLNGNSVSKSGNDKEKNGIEQVGQEFRISVEDLADIRKSKSHGGLDVKGKSLSSYTLIDVRPSVEFSICHLEEAVNVPLQSVEDDAGGLVEKINMFKDSRQTILICRRGNASRKALQTLRNGGALNVKDVIGGLQQWHDAIDSSFPTY